MPCSSSNPLPRLREIRAARAYADSLVPERDALIRQAIGQDHSIREIAEAAGLSRSQTQRISVP